MSEGTKVRPVSEILEGLDINAPVSTSDMVLAAYVILKVLDSDGEAIFIESTSDNFTYYEKLGVITQVQNELVNRNTDFGCNECSGHD
jgi:hypothetical protein